MSIWTGLDGGCSWAYFWGPISDEDWQQYLDGIAGPCRVPGLRVVSLTVAFSRAAPTGMQRKRLAGLSKSLVGFDRVNTAHAFVSDSPITRGALTAINWIARKPMPEKIFAHVGPALDWLQQRPELDRQALLQTMRQAIPPDLQRLPVA